MKEHGAVERTEILGEDYPWAEDGCKRYQDLRIDDGEIDLWDWMQMTMNDAWLSCRRFKDVRSEWHSRVRIAIGKVYWRTDK